MFRFVSKCVMIDTIKLFRFPFSIFLMPVYLFALSQSEQVNISHIITSFFILHLLVYPSSNAYNSYMDQDEGPIGGLKNPPKAGKNVFYLSILFDVLACLFALFIDMQFALGILLYILASRAYSYKGIRLKKYPIAGYLTVVFFQGFFTYQIVFDAMNGKWDVTINPLIASLLIAGVYPLTQIYQHIADKQSGDQTISLLLGYKGTFMFTATIFLFAAILFYIQLSFEHFLLMQFFFLPIIIYFIYWASKVWKDTSQANFEHTMRMNVLASSCMNLFFITISILNLSA